MVQPHLVLRAPCCGRFGRNSWSHLPIMSDGGTPNGPMLTGTRLPRPAPGKDPFNLVFGEAVCGTATLETGVHMKRKMDEWPWNRPWPWMLFIAPVAVFLGLIWIPIGSCSMYPAGFQGDTS